jgi:hypothetical protein
MGFFDKLKKVLNPLQAARGLGKIAGRLPGSNVAGGILNPLALGGKLAGRAGRKMGGLPGGRFNPLAMPQKGRRPPIPTPFAEAQGPTFSPQFSPQGQGNISDLSGNASAIGAAPSFAAPADSIGLDVERARKLNMIKRSMDGGGEIL